MSTVAPRPPAPPPPPSLSPALVDSEGYIDQHIRRTRRSLKLVDFAAGVLTLVMGLLAFLFVAGLIDHWVVPGGLGVRGRMTMFGILVLGLAWYGWRQFVPLLRSINPVYAAHTIEQSSPSLKNSLLNVLLFRTHRQDMSARVYHALQQQAAQRLSAAPADATIDHAALLRLGYALIAVVAACALYAVLSPKNLVVSAGRVLAPWSDLAAPSRVHITDVKPGDASVALGERVNISAEILGAADDDRVRLRYTTDDESLVDESITMTRAAGAVRFAADLPRATDAARALGPSGATGVQQPLEYWIEAGDARSRRFKLGVFQRPTIVVQRVHYQYPDYTREPPATVDNIGDVRGIEGTTVTIEALANQPIKSASIDFDADGSSDQRMTVDGEHATASFTLALRPDRRTPWHLTYALRFTTTEGRANDDPVQHRLDVTPDYPPEIRITQPEEPELTARAGDTVLINVEARDPDYALAMVRLVGRVGDRDVLLSDLLAGRQHAGLYKHLHPFVPADAQLKAGEVLEYWAEAADNRTPEPNVGISEHRRLTIVADDAPANPQQQNNQGQGSGAGDQGANNGDGAEGADGEPASAGGQQGENGKPSDSGEGEQQGGQGAAGGTGDSGQSQESDAAGGESQAGGEGGESSDQNAATAGGSGQSQSEQPQNGENPSPSAGESASADGRPNDNSSDPGGDASSQGTGGQPGDASQAASQERVSTAGDQDSDAFDRIAQHMQPEDAENDAAGESASTENSDANPNGASAAPQPTAGESASADGSATETPASDQPSTGAQSSDDGSASEQTPAGEGQTPAGPDGANNPDNGAAPAGDHGGEPGAPDAANKQPGEQSGDDESQSGADAEAPTADSRGDRESQSRGDSGGDRSGGGQQGGGQQADNAGQGEAGSHEPSDTGANQSADPGAGETGTEAGNEQLANGQTGESSGDTPGAGSESQASDQGASGATGSPNGQPGGSDPAQSPEDPVSRDAQGPPEAERGATEGDQSSQSDAAGDQGSDAGQSGSNPGESASAGGPPGQSSDANPAGDPADQPGDPSTGAPPAGGQSPAAGDAPPSGENPSDQSTSDNPSQGGASTSPPTGGTHGGSLTEGHSTAPEPGGDEANLDYARRQTDLVLSRLDDQLAKHKVDPALLKSLGWTEDELRQFVDRWKSLKAAAEAPGDGADAARDELNAALRSLGLRPRGPLQVRGAATPDELRDLNEAYRARPPVEYADRVRAYVRGAAEE